MLKHFMRSGGAACAALLLSVGASQATLLVYEDFNYTPTGDRLVGTTYLGHNSCWGGIGFPAFNPWINPVPTIAQYVPARVHGSSLSYPSGVSLTPSGRNWRVLRSENPVFNGCGYGARSLASGIDFGSTGVYYVSFLMQNNPGNANGYFFVQLARASDSAIGLNMGMTGTRRARVGYAYTGFAADGTVNLDTNGLYFMVAKITTAAGTNMDTYAMNFYHQVSNTVTLAEPCTWTLNYRTNLANIICDTIGVLGGDAGSGGVIFSNHLDEIRIGTTWADVTGNTGTPATITFNNLTQSYNGAARTVTATTAPGGLSVTITYAGGAAPVSPGTYTVTGKVCDATYAGTATGTLTVNKATPTISVLPTASALTYGAALSASTLSGGTASVPGSFAFTSPATIPNAGTNGQPVTFTPTDSVNYSNVITTVSVVVAKATPSIITPPTASALAYGQALSASTLSGGTASVPGTFAFNSPLTVPDLGTSSHGVTFTATDAGNFHTAGLTVNVLVNKAVPTINASPTATPITFGQTLADSTLSGGAASVAGTFAFTTPATAPSAGTANQSVTFTPTDTVHYENVAFNVSVTVNKITPTILTPPISSTIVEGQSLAQATLSGGSASVPGTFAFTTPATTPGVGSASHSVTFTPTDSASYATVTLSVNVTVLANVPPVLAAVGHRVGFEGQFFSFVITASDPNTTIPQLEARGLPVGATLTVITNGGHAEGTVSWTPPPGAHGVYPVRFAASDGTFEDWEVARLYVGYTGESLCSGLPCSLYHWAPAISNIVASTTSTQAHVEWYAVDGVYYDLYSSTNPFAASPVWATLQSGQQGTGSLEQETDNGLGTAMKRFYRLALTGDSPGTNGLWGVIRKDVRASDYTLIAPPLRTDQRFDGGLGAMLAGPLSGNDDGPGGAGDEVVVLNGDGSWRTLYLDSAKVWRESNGDASTYVLAPGQGFMVRRSAPSIARLTFSGAVGNDATQTNRIREGWNIIGLSEGKTLQVKNALATASPVGGTSEEVSDQLVIQNADGSWRRLMYVQGWGAPYDGNWFDLSAFQIATNVLDPGAAYYYYRQPAGGDTDLEY